MKETIRLGKQWQGDEVEWSGGDSSPHVAFERMNKLRMAREGLGYLVNRRTLKYTSDKIGEINGLCCEVYREVYGLEEKPKGFTEEALRKFNERLWTGKGIYVIGSAIPQFSDSHLMISPETFIWGLDSLLEQTRDSQKAIDSRDSHSFDKGVEK